MSLTDEHRTRPLPLLSRVELFAALGVFASTCLIVYFAMLGNGFVTLDDPNLIYQNPAVKQLSVSSLRHIFTSYDPELYIPLTLFTFQVERFLFGFDPFFFHATNLLLHIGNVFLVFLFLYSLLGRKWVAFWCALLFAVHPVNVEAVSWVTGRKDLLATFFALLSMLFYLHYRFSRGWKPYVGGIVAFLCALLSKVSILLLPFALFLIDFRDNRPLSRFSVMEKVPYFLLTLQFGVIAMLGKTTVLSESTFYEKILMSFKSTAFYWRTFFFPAELTAIYSFNGDITIADPTFFVPILIVLVVLALTLLSLKRTREVIFGVGFFFLFLVPSFINFSKGGALYFASDRYVYLSFIGLFALLGVGIDTLLHREERHVALRHRLRTATVVFSFITLACGHAAYAQSLTWKDSLALYTTALERYPDSFLAHNNLANVYFADLGRPDKAEEHFQKALALRPGHHSVLNNLGILYRGKGLFEKAEEMHLKAIAAKPEYAEAYYSMGFLMMTRQRIPEAKTWYEKALTINPDHVRSHINLAALQLSEGNVDEAMAHFDAVLAIDPTVPEAHYNRAIVLEQTGRVEEAEAAYRNAIRFHPRYTDAYNNLGALLSDRGQLREALEMFEAALAIDPDNPMASANAQALRSALGQ